MPVIFVISEITAQSDYKHFFQESIDFLISTQCDSTIEGKQYAGEWPVYMNLTEPYFFIGRKQRARDSNCFSVSAIHNFLAEIYLRDTSLNELKPILTNAFKEIQNYETNKRYNFWKSLPANRSHYWVRKNPDLRVRRPTNYKLRSRFINKTANVPEDADDTSQGNMAVYYHNRIFNDTIPAISYDGFDEFLDTRRKNRNWYNVTLNTPRQSGAYLTWHHQEYSYTLWNPLSTFFSLAFIFTPFSSGYPEAYQPWIPFGANDVDVVVNSNVLHYLALSGQLDSSSGKSGAINVIKHSVSKNLWNSAGIYYPNAYHLDYAISKAFANGVEELEDAAIRIVKHLKETQKPDGSFECSKWLNKGDIVQSTAYALHAMLDLQSMGLKVSDDNIEKAFEFLFSKSIRNNGTCHWEGGVYFSGGTLLRNILVWQSDAYTTALIAKCIQRHYLK